MLYIYIYSKPRTKKQTLREYTKRRGVQTLTEAILLEQKKTAEIDQFKIQKNSSSEKIKKFHFSSQEMGNLKEKKSLLSQSKKKKSKTENKVTLGFNLVKELDFIWPNVEGTYQDFSQAVDRVSDVLSPFLKDDEELRIHNYLETKRYSLLAKTLKEICLSLEGEASVKTICQSKFFSYLDYGHCLENKSKRKFKFDIDYPNLKFSQEISLLLEKLFLKHCCEKEQFSWTNIKDFLDKTSLSFLEKQSFTKSIEELGQDVLDLLLEDFLSSLKPQKRKYAMEYRCFRLVLRNTNSQDPKKVGKLIQVVIRDMRAIHKQISKTVAFQTPEEVAHLVTLVKRKTLASPNLNKVLEVEKNKDQELRLLIFSIIVFLGWYPKDDTLFEEEERDLLAYFDQLLYSRRTRLEIVRDTKKKDVGQEFTEKLHIVQEKMKEAESLLKDIQASKKTDIIGATVEIAVPRQCEDYFPLRGTLEDIFVEPCQIGNLIKLEISEKNRLKSFVIFTGNNIQFM